MLPGDSLRRAVTVSNILFGKRPFRSYSAEEMVDAFQGPRFFKARREECVGNSFIALCVRFGLLFSKSEP